MPVEFLIGPAGSGKTARCLDTLRQREREGRATIFLVPEQFTYTADRLLLSGDLEGSRHVRILSFNRLTHLLEAAGDPFPKTVEPGGREMLLRLVMERVSAENLGPLASQKGKEGFIRVLATTIRDLRGHARDPEQPLAQRLISFDVTDDPTGEGSTLQKLRGLGRILEAYEQLLAEQGLRDPEDRLDMAVERIEESGALVSGKEIVVDGFMSFTAPEIRMLCTLAQKASRLVVALCLDPADLKIYREEAAAAEAMGLYPETGFPSLVYRKLNRPIFSPTARTFLILEEALREIGGAPALVPLPGRPRFLKNDLERVEREAIGPGQPGITLGDTEAVIEAVAAVHPADEVLHWARRIDRWIRLGDLPRGPNAAPPRYRDVVILVQEPEGYIGLLREIFPRYNIPFFLDIPIDITSHPFPAALLSILAVIERRWSRDAVMSLLRSPLLEMTPFEADLVENLSLQYGIEFHRWTAKPWEAMILPRRRRVEEDNPDETEEIEEPDDEERRYESVEQELEIQRIQCDLGNRVREEILLRVEDYEKRWSQETIPFREAASGLTELVDQLNLIETLYNKKRRNGELYNEDRPHAGETPAEKILARQVVDRTAAFLEEGVRLMGDVPVTPALFSALLREGLQALRLGRTPQSLDAVTIGDFQRSRVNEARAAILGGFTAEAVPRTVSDRPLFSEDEEADLARKGLSMGPSPQARQDEEAYLVYIALTRARERLCLTYPAATATGDSLHASPYLTGLARRLGLKIASPGGDGEILDPQTLEELTTLVGSGLSERIEAEEAGEAAPTAGMMPPQVGAAAGSARAVMGSAPMNLDRLYNEFCAGASSHPQSFEILRRSLIYQRPWKLDREILSLLYPGSKLKTSASGLETFARCPYQLFVRKILRIEPRPEAVPRPRDTGNALHKALEILFGRPGATPDPNNVEELLSRIFKTLRDSQEFLAFTLDAPSRYQWDRGRRGLTHYARAEAHRLAESLYKPLLAEAAFGFPQEEGGKPALVIRAAGGRSIELRGRIDRLDTQAGRRAVVLDYKTGRQHETIRTVLERGEKLQAGLYMLALQEVFELRPAGAFYVGILPGPIGEEKQGDPENPLDIRQRGVILDEEAEAYDPRHCFVHGLSRGGKTGLGAEEMTQLLNLTRAYTAQFGGRILDGEIGAVPYGIASQGDPKPCQYCEARSLCRFDPLRSPIRHRHPEPAMPPEADHE
ncbi:MAG: PD-(D/E)XK nuclease family protein [Candidatus Eisenbacteria bacterium]|uniref:PD-(D/E)XK nuclease family protein n=1 Tax=Eiseniibacteriota bacterium TaxID=2212470 RepID=A0A948RX55_UNCEI|nr:PD-(D/E)XK nuclease family protein [Candidatus Eisenbacteria bacterium]MBU1947759.1 PD-(D/E)XK nuclease family protein [Candidatus Eisenbacteria bacterium]MBU2692121.1 PD-(D/E)XK nuclease family protein [Candidatus Eisenbacteria bacterium]